MKCASARRATIAHGIANDFDHYEREYVFDDWTDRGFRALDDNRDSRITRDEWHFDREGFRRADHNNDRAFSRARNSSLKDAEDDDRGDSFPNLDANRDGRVSRDEWHGSPSRFALLDDNRDGFISRTEMLGTSAPPELFSSVDMNRDRAITANEWHWSRASFDRLDVNRDGRLSAQEFNRTAAPAPARKRRLPDRRTNAGSSKGGRPAVKSVRTTGRGTSKARWSSSRPTQATSPAWGCAPITRRAIARRSARRIAKAGIRQSKAKRDKAL